MLLTGKSEGSCYTELSASVFSVFFWGPPLSAFFRGLLAQDVLGNRQEGTMLFTIAVILLVLWLLGLVSGYTLGNFIYVLLVIAIVLFLVRLISGRRVV